MEKMIYDIEIKRMKERLINKQFESITYIMSSTGNPTIELSFYVWNRTKILLKNLISDNYCFSLIYGSSLHGRLVWGSSASFIFILSNASINQCFVFTSTTDIFVTRSDYLTNPRTIGIFNASYKYPQSFNN